MARSPEKFSENGLGAVHSDFAHTSNDEKVLEQPFAPRTMCMDDLDQLMRLSAMSSGQSDSEQEESDEEDDEDEDWDSGSNRTDERSGVVDSEDQDSDSNCTEQGSLPVLRDDDFFDCLREQASDNSGASRAMFSVQDQQWLQNRPAEHSHFEAEVVFGPSGCDRTSAVEVSPSDMDSSIRSHDSGSETGHNSSDRGDAVSSVGVFSERSSQIALDSELSSPTCIVPDVPDQQQHGDRGEAFQDSYMGNVEDSIRVHTSVRSDHLCDVEAAIRPFDEGHRKDNWETDSVRGDNNGGISDGEDGDSDRVSIESVFLPVLMEDNLLDCGFDHTFCAEFSAKDQLRLHGSWGASSTLSANPGRNSTIETCQCVATGAGSHNDASGEGHRSNDCRGSCTSFGQVCQLWHAIWTKLHTG